jgi:hypothetical protein
MNALKNSRLLIGCLLMNATMSLFSQHRNSYVSLNNTKEVNTHNENYISALDAGTVFGIGEYVYAGGGITFAKIWGPGYSSLGAGIGPDLQIYLIQRKKFRFTLEGKGRVMGLFPEYPADALNYAFWGGPMAEFSLSERHRLKFGICYNHLSNARPVEQVMNKSLDGIGFNIGWAFY